MKEKTKSSTKRFIVLAAGTLFLAGCSSMRCMNLKPNAIEDFKKASRIYPDLLFLSEKQEPNLNQE